MKTANFPARKLARKIAAEMRANGQRGWTASAVLFEGFTEVARARNFRTKKRRV
jgi:hypothetical protein